MAELKPGWRLVKFGDVVQLNRDRCANPAEEGIERYVGLEHIDPEDLRIRRWGLVAEGTTFTNLFKPGQVLFGKRRAYQRKVAVADFEGVCSGDIYVFESKDAGVLLPDLLPFICQTDGFFDHAVGTSAGSLSPRTNWTQLSQYEFALPPLDEQRRIAEVFQALENAVNELRSLEATLTLLADSLVTQMLVSLEYESSLTLGDRADIAYGLTVDRKRRNASRRIPYLRVANVDRGTIDLTELKDIGFLDGDEVYLLEENDVLVVEGHANSAEVGRAAIWQGNSIRCAHQNHLIRVRCRADLDPHFIALYLNSIYGRRHFRRHAKSTSGLNTINSTVVKTVPLPQVGLDEQRQIVTQAEYVRNQCISSAKRISELAEMKQRFMAALACSYPVQFYRT